LKYLLKIVKGINLDTVFEIIDNNIYEIRRLNIYDKDKRVNIIYLDSEEVSKLHAKLFMVKGVLIIHDLNSTNGVFVNNKKISKTVLKENDILKIGDTEFKIIKDETNSDLTFINKKNNFKKLTKNFKSFLKIKEEDLIFSPDYSSLKFNNLNSDIKDILNKVKNIIKEHKDNSEQYRNIKDYFFEVEVVSGLQKNSIFKFYRQEITIGRAADLIIEDDLVSKEHVKISLISNNLFKVSI